MKKRSKNFTFSLLLALILSFVGGILEAYSLTNRGFFALMQTGNLISVFINLVKTDWNSLLVSFIVVFTFIVGLIISNVIEFICEKKKKDYQPFELMICVALLVLVIFIPVEFNKENALNGGFDYYTNNPESIIKDYNMELQALGINAEIPQSILNYENSSSNITNDETINRHNDFNKRSKR